MENKQINETLDHAGESEQEVSMFQNEITFEKLFKKQINIKKIFLFLILLFLGACESMTAFRMENKGMGSIIFVSSIVALIPLVLLYIISFINVLRTKKKCSLDCLTKDCLTETSNKIQISLLMFFAFAYVLVTFIVQGIYRYAFDVLQGYFIIGFAALLFDLIVTNKKVFKNKLVLFTTIVFVVVSVLTFFADISILKTLAIGSLVVVVVSIVFRVITLKLGNEFLTRKQFLSCISLAMVVFVLFCTLNIASQKTIDKRTYIYREMLVKDLAGKIFITDTENFVRGYVFDNEGKYCCIYEDGDKDDTYYEVEVNFNWFGFGNIRIEDGEIYDEIIYDEQGNAVALSEKDWNNKEIVYKLSDSIPCFEHEFGDPVTVKEAKSCQDPGVEKETCIKCGYEETSTIKGSHTYVNRYCSVCGEKQPVKYAYDIEANTWYTYNPLPQLKCQNCVISNVYSFGSKLEILYYPVCAHCHAYDEGLKTIAISDSGTMFDYCLECGGQTVISFSITS